MNNEVWYVLPLIAGYLLLNNVNIIYLLVKSKSFTETNSLVGWLFSGGETSLCKAVWGSNLLIVFVSMAIVGFITIILGGWVAIIIYLLACILMYIIIRLVSLVVDKVEWNIKLPDNLKPTASHVSLWYKIVKGRYCPIIKIEKENR